MLPGDTRLRSRRGAQWQGTHANATPSAAHATATSRFAPFTPLDPEHNTMLDCMLLMGKYALHRCYVVKPGGRGLGWLGAVGTAWLPASFLSALLQCNQVASASPRPQLSGGDVINIVTQSMLVRFLRDHLEQFKELGAKTVAELNLGASMCSVLPLIVVWIYLHQLVKSLAAFHLFLFSNLPPLFPPPIGTRGDVYTAQTTDTFMAAFAKMQEHVSVHGLGRAGPRPLAHGHCVHARRTDGVFTLLSFSCPQGVSALPMVDDKNIVKGVVSARDARLLLLRPTRLRFIHKSLSFFEDLHIEPFGWQVRSAAIRATCPAIVPLVAVSRRRTLCCDATNRRRCA